MKSAVLFALTALAVSTGALAQDQQQAVIAHAHLIGLDRKPVGTATLTVQAAGVKIHLNVSGLQPGQHGVHLHAAGRCVPPFASAGGHFNPDNHQHGLENPAGSHMGDLPNLTVGQDGKATVDLLVKGANLVLGPADGIPQDPGPYTLVATAGTSIIVDAKPDDNKTDPDGNSGARIACGVVENG